MNKSILAIVLCFIAALAFTNAVGTVSVSWMNDYTIDGVYSHMILDITKVQLSTSKPLYFIGRHTSNDQLDTTYRFSPQLYGDWIPATYDLGVTRYPDNNDVSCINVETGQFVATLRQESSVDEFPVSADYTVDGGNNIMVIQFNNNAFENTFYGTEAGQSLPTMKLKCPIYIANRSPPVSTVVSFFFHDDRTDNTYFNSVNVTLPYPKERKTPSMQFTSLSYKQADKSAISSSTVEVNFNTDTPGIYSIIAINAPGWSYASYTDGKPMDLWCSSGSTAKAARIFFDQSEVVAFVHVTSVPDTKVGLKCVLYTNDNENDFFIVRSERSSIQIALGAFSVARTIDLPLNTATFRVATSAITPTQVTLSVSVNSNYAHNGITRANSTIEFKIGSQLDVSLLQLATQQQGYQQFSCGSTYGTIFVNKGGNSIILKDVNTLSTWSQSFTCTFAFFTASTWKFGQDANTSSLQVSIDGVSLESAYNRGTVHPIYYRAGFRFENEISTTKLEGDNYKVIQHFNLQDAYDQYAVTPTRPVIQLTFDGPTTFSIDDMASQLKCKSSTPTDSKLHELKLTFNDKVLAWYAPLPSIVGVEVYDLYFECEFTVKRIVQYGIDITPEVDLTINAFDLVDRIRFQNSFSNSISGPDVTPITTEPSTDQLPKNPIMHAVFTSVMEIPNGNIGEQLTKTGEYFQSSIKKAVSDGLDYSTGTAPFEKVAKDWTIETTGSVSSNVNYNSKFNAYMNYEAADDFNSWRTETIGDQWIPFDLRVPGELPYGTLVRQNFDSGVFSKHANVKQYMTLVYNNSIPTISELNAMLPGLVAATYTQSIPQVVRQAPVYSVTDSIEGLPTFSASTSDTYFANPIQGCGYAAIQIPITDSESTFYNMSIPYNWTIYQSISQSNYIRRLCQAGESCTMNADCESQSWAPTYCKAGKCTIQAVAVPPYISYTSVAGQYLTKLYYNSTPMVSLSLAFIAVIIAVFAF